MSSPTSQNQRHLENPAVSRAVSRLSDRVEISQRRLGSHLNSLYEAHVLKARDLWDAQRKISRLMAQGTEPTPSEFWSDTAQPWASVLTSTCISAIEAEAPVLVSAAERFVESVAIENSRGAAITNAAIRTALADHLATPMLQARPKSTELDQLGVVWHSRLRRCAWRKTFPAALFRSAAESDLRTGQAQVQLASQGPWAHGDRLLSAFEGAHAEVRSYYDDCLARIVTVQPTSATLNV